MKHDILWLSDFLLLVVDQKIILCDLFIQKFKIDNKKKQRDWTNHFLVALFFFLRPTKLKLFNGSEFLFF
mgnify:CR=1 FL=1